MGVALKSYAPNTLRGELGVEPRATQEIECGHGLRNEAIPEMQRKMLIDAAEAGDEMILESPNRAFGRVAAVDARRDKLESDRFVGEELFERRGTFIVETLESRAKTSTAEERMNSLVAGKDGSGTAILDGLGQNAVAIEIVHDDEVVVAGAGRGHEATGLI